MARDDRQGKRRGERGRIIAITEERKKKHIKIQETEVLYLFILWVAVYVRILCIPAVPPEGAEALDLEEDDDASHPVIP